MKTFLDCSKSAVRGQHVDLSLDFFGVYKNKQRFSWNDI